MLAGSRKRRATVTAVCLFGLFVGLSATARTDRAAAGFSTGLADPEFVSTDRDARLDEANRAGARFVRINVSWAAAANRPPGDPTDPGDPAYDFRGFDAAIASVRAKGLEPMLTVGQAPPFAEGGGRPSAAPAGSWKPDPGAYGQFARAVAIRYSGDYQGLPQRPVLPGLERAQPEHLPGPAVQREAIGRARIATASCSTPSTPASRASTRRTW